MRSDSVQMRGVSHRLWQLVVALTLVVTSGMVIPSTAHADQPTGSCHAKTSTLSWGIRSKFVSMISTVGTIDTSGQATFDKATKSFRWTPGTGTWDGTSRTGRIDFTGGLRMHGFATVDFKLNDPQLVIEKDKARLIADITSNTKAGQEVKHGRIPVVDVDTTGLTADKGALTLKAAKTTLTAEAAPAFGDFLTQGKPMEPLSLTVALDCAPSAPAPAHPITPGPAVTVPKPAAETPAHLGVASAHTNAARCVIFTKARFVWGIKTSFIKFVESNVEAVDGQPIWQLDGVTRKLGEFPSFTWTKAQGTWNPATKTGVITFQGTLRIKGKIGNNFEFALTDPVLHIGPDGKSHLTVTKVTSGASDLSGRNVYRDNLRFLEVDTSKTLHVGEKSVTVLTAPTQLTPDARPALMNAYPANTPGVMDSIYARFSHSDNKPCEPAAPAPGTGDEPKPPAPGTDNKPLPPTTDNQPPSTPAKPEPAPVGDAVVTPGPAPELPGRPAASPAQVKPAVSCTADPRDRTISHGSMSWGITKTFQASVQSIGKGGWDLKGTTYTNGAFGWANGSGTYDRVAKTGRVQFPGSVRLHGFNKILDLNLSQPALIFKGGNRAVLEASVNSNDMQGKPHSYGRIHIGDVDLSTLRVTDNSLSLQGATVTMADNESAVKAFAGFLKPGKTLDPLTFTARLTEKETCHDQAGNLVSRSGHKLALASGSTGSGTGAGGALALTGSPAMTLLLLALIAIAAGAVMTVSGRFAFTSRH